MDNSQKTKWFYLLTLVFVVVVCIDLFGEYLEHKQIVVIVKPLISVVLLTIYWINSVQRNTLFIITILLGLISSILFIPNSTATTFWGVTVFAVHRLLLIVFLLRLLQPKDFFPIIIASLPLLLISFYLVSITLNLDIKTIVLFSANNILTSLFCGIVVANYVMKEENNNTWLLISTLMYVALQLIVYIEKFYLIEFSPRILRPTAVFFFAIALFTLVRGVLSQERLNGNTPA